MRDYFWVIDCATYFSINFEEMELYKFDVSQKKIAVVTPHHNDKKNINRLKQSPSSSTRTKKTERDASCPPFTDAHKLTTLLYEFPRWPKCKDRLYINIK